LSFWIAHGITPEVQIEMENYYDSYQIQYGVSQEMSSVQIQNTNYISITQENHTDPKW
jgi:hypothetical protein